MSAETPKGGQLSKRRRRHKAAGGRVAASGLGAGALLGIVGALGAHAATTAGTTKAASVPRSMPAAVALRRVPTTTPTTIVWRTIHRVIVVTDPPLASGAPSSGGSSARTYAPAYTQNAPTVSSPAPAPAAPPPVAAPAPAPAPAPQPAPAPAPPACSGSKCP